MGTRKLIQISLFVFSFFLFQSNFLQAEPSDEVAVVDEVCGQPEGIPCRECDVCGNDFCEPPENAKPKDTNNPNGCPEDCLEFQADPNLPLNPQQNCGVIDVAPFQIVCDDGDICTQDTCEHIPPTALVGTCNYDPKSCSGPISDGCCPAGCNEDATPGNNFYDTDCCDTPGGQGNPTPTPTAFPTPTPTPTPTPIPNVTPNPSGPGQGTPTPIGAAQLQGSGDLCSLQRNAAANWFSVYGILALVGFMGLFSRNLRRK